MWREVRVKLRGIVDSKYFNRGIMIAILVNTISMGIEHHEQVRHGRWAVGNRVVLRDTAWLKQQVQPAGGRD